MYVEDPYLVRFNFHIYEQKCRACKATAASYILQDDEMTLYKIHTDIVQLLFEMGIHEGEHISLDDSISRGTPSQEDSSILSQSSVQLGGARIGGPHDTHLCEACHKGKCWYNKKKSKSKRTIYCRSKKEVLDQLSN